jgi:hypothetical protein
VQVLLLRKFATGMLLVMLLAPFARADATASASLFDPTRHMHVSEVHRGMKGYGLTVFQGTKIERFGVEVVDVVKNFNPKYDVVLIRCDGEYLEHTGSIAGMSGSPIYLYDDSGKARMIGAFAYGWPLSKDPLAGVQPIEYMLNLPANATTQPSDVGSDASGDNGSGAANQAVLPRWSIDDLPAPWGKAERETDDQRNYGARYESPWLGREIHLQPLATPLMVGNVSGRAFNQIAELLQGSGLEVMQAGGGNGEASPSDVVPPLEPGSVLAVPLLMGDLELTAIGTCTEKIGDRIFGFGHPFMSEGRINLPMASGSIAMIVPNLETSFKLGFMSKTSGTLKTDQTVGVAGIIGQLPPMIPIDIHIVYDDGSIDQTYHFSAAVHSKLTAQMAAAALGVAMTGDKELPEFHTTDYDLTLDFADGQSVHVANTSVNEGPAGAVNDVLMAVTAATDNPFQQVQLAKLSGTVRVSSTARESQILSVMIPRSKYEPGDNVKGFISYQPFRAQEATLPIELKLPRDLPDGTYQLTVSDWSHYLDDQRNNCPFEFTANNIDEMFAVLRDIESIQHNAIYIRLVRKADGVAVGRTAMPLLPSSDREVLMGAGRSDITEFVSSTVKVIPSELVMNGSADFSITIEKHGKVEVASPGGVKTDNSATAAPSNPPGSTPGKGSDAKPVAPTEP